MTPYQVLDHLLGCAETELGNQAPPFYGVPERVYVSPDAQVVADNCCEDGGQLWTRVLSAMPVNPLGVPDSSVTSCNKSMGLQVGVGVIRCGHTLDDHANPPSPDDLTGDARQLAEDMVSLYQAIVCCSGLRLVLGTWTPFPALGGCMGGEWSVWVAASFTPDTGSP